MSSRTRELLREGAAARAWVTHCAYKEDSDLEYLVQYCFQVSDHLIKSSWSGCFDAFHLSIGHPDYGAWMHEAFREGGTFTVLFDHRNPGDHEIYGNLEPRIKRSLSQIAGALRRTLDPAKRSALAEQFLGIAVTTQVLIDDEEDETYDEENERGAWDVHLEAMRRLGLARGRILPATRNLKTIQATFCGGEYDREALSTLSRICERYVPGVWAAK